MNRSLLLVLSVFFAFLQTLKAQWEPNTSINTLVSNDTTSHFKSIVTSSGGTYIVYWKEVSNPLSPFELWIQLLNGDGVKQFGPEGLMVYPSLKQGTTPGDLALAVDAEDNVIIAYNTVLPPQYIYLQKMSPIGELLWGETGLEAGTGQYPRLQMVDGGDVLLGWKPADSAPAVIRAISASGALLWSAPRPVSAGNATANSYIDAFFRYPEGDILVLFHALSSANAPVYLMAQRYTTAGDSVWANATQVSALPFQPNTEVSVASDGEQCYVGFISAQNGLNNAFLQRILPDGSLAWGNNGRDFDTRSGVYNENNVSIASEPAGNHIWALCTYGNLSGPMALGEYEQKLTKDTGQRLFSDTAKSYFKVRPLTQAHGYRRGALRMIKNRPAFVTFYRADATNSRLIAQTVDPNGDTKPFSVRNISTTNFDRSNITVNHPVYDQLITAWVENRPVWGTTRCVAQMASCNLPNEPDFTFTQQGTTVNTIIDYPERGFYYNEYDYGDQQGYTTSSIHTYTLSGTYNICMKVSTLCGDTALVCKTVEIACDTIPQLTCLADTLEVQLSPAGVNICSYDVALSDLTDLTNTCDLEHGIMAPGGIQVGTELNGAHVGLPLLGWVRYVKTDSVCMRPVKILDNPFAVARCKATTVYLDANGTAIVTPEMLDNGSVGKCSSVPYFKIWDINNPADSVLVRDTIVVNCDYLEEATYSLQLRVYRDFPGEGPVAVDLPQFPNSACIATILIQDTMLVQCVPPPDTVVLCEAFNPNLLEQYGSATITDNCSLAPVMYTANVGGYDTICGTGIVTRTWQTTDASGDTFACTQQINVVHDQNYWIKFPADIIVTDCQNVSLGEPEFYGVECEKMSVTYTDQLESTLSACRQVLRTWKVYNICTYDSLMPFINVPNPLPNNTPNHPSNLPGVTLSPSGTLLNGWAPTSVRITPQDPAPTNYSIFWQKEANGYIYTQIIRYLNPQGPVINQCPAEAGEYCTEETNDTLLWKNALFNNPVYGSTDLREGAVPLTLEASTACDWNTLSFDFELYLDLNGDGFQETRIRPGDALTPGEVKFGNVGSSAPVPVLFDLVHPATADKWVFVMKRDTQIGQTVKMRLVWQKASDSTVTMTPRLPLGGHFIRWTVTDGCGTDRSCTYNFEVKDCKAPTVDCQSDISVNFTPGMPQLNLYLNNFSYDISDNASTDSQILVGMRIKNEPDGQGNSEGFPVAQNGSPQTGIIVNCSHVDTNFVEIWAKDLAGNTHFCEVYLLVNDNQGVCTNDSSLVILGFVETELGLGVEDAQIHLLIQDGNLPGITDTTETDSMGRYLYPNLELAGKKVTVRPSFTLDVLNGVNTYDLILISRHILGLEPLNTPYKIIAADANRSGTVTTFDIVEFRKLILGSYSKLPNNSSWRFVDATQIFSNPDNPFADTIRESLLYPYIQQSIEDAHFVGVKIGDLDNTVTPNNLQSTEDRTHGTLLFDVQDRTVTAGETFAVTFTADQVVQGYQFTLNLNGLKVESLAGEGMNEEHFALFSNALTTSWDAPVTFNGKAAFTVTFTATKGGKLSEMLSVSSRITKALAFVSTSLNESEGFLNPAVTGEKPASLDIALRFRNTHGTTVVGPQFELYQNTPNPWADHTMIGFYLPESSAVTLRIFDAFGREVLAQQGQFGRGNHEFTVENIGANVSGLLYYTVETAFGKATKRMQIIEN